MPFLTSVFIFNDTSIYGTKIWWPERGKNVEDKKPYFFILQNNNMILDNNHKMYALIVLLIAC